MASRGTTVISDFGRSKVQQRTRKSGAQTHTISIKSAPVAVVVDAQRLGLPVAEALASQIKAQIAAIVEPASPATIKMRERAASGPMSRQAAKRYTGGRTGMSTPNSQGGGRLFNDSGRLAQSIAIQWVEREGAFVVNCAKNRLNPDTFPGGAMGAAYQQMVGKLVELVPVLREPLADNVVFLAQRRSTKAMHTKGRMGESGAAVAARASTLFDIDLRQIASAVKFVAGAVA